MRTLLNTLSRLNRSGAQIGLVLSISCANSVAFAGLLFTGDFESGQVSDKFQQEKCCSYSLQASKNQARNGSYSMRVELNKSDPNSNVGSKRSEVGPSKSTGLMGTMGSERWFGFSVYIPSDWVNDNVRAEEIVFQIHERPDSTARCSNEQYRSPFLSLLIIEGNFVVEKRWDSRACTPGNAYEGRARFPTPLTKGKWNDFVIHAKWSYKSDGILQVWKDGKLFVDSTGPNDYNDLTEGYMKMGLYKWGWASAPNESRVNSRILYLDDLRIGDANSNYAEVAPRGSQSPSPTPVPTPVPTPGSTPVPTPVPTPPPDPGATPSPTPIAEVDGANPAVYTAGRPLEDGSGWKLNLNGEVGGNINFPSSGTYKIQVTAWGQPMLGIAPKMELRIDGEVVESVDVTADTPTLYEFEVTVTQGLHRVTVALTNDLNTSKADPSIMSPKLRDPSLICHSTDDLRQPLRLIVRRSNDDQDEV